MQMKTLMCTVAMLLIAGTVYADLQNVVVGGQIDIRGRYFMNAYESGAGPAARPSAVIRIPGAQLPRRAIGAADVASNQRYGEGANDWAHYEENASIYVAADFTDEVAGFVEFYSYYVWGEDFRSDYVTGIDNRAGTNVDLLQSYIEAKDMFGRPVRLRIGRQVMQFGKESDCFLLAGNLTPMQRFSYDGIRLTATPIDNLTVDAWMMKLAEMSPLEQDGDVDFYGIRGEYKCCDALTIAPFWYYIRDARSIADTYGSFVQEWVEDVVGLDDYPVTELHTVGFESAGKCEPLDYALRVAYQWGDAGQLGARFKLPIAFMGNRIHGDDGAEYGKWGMDATIGYTFADTTWKFRPFIRGAYYQGEDNRDVSLLEWLNPFHTPEASVSFNRLFSDINYTPAINDNGDMTNFKMLQLGLAMKPTEKLSWQVRAYNVWADETFSWPLYINVPRTSWWLPTGRLLIAPMYSFLDVESSDNLGFTIDTTLKYNYSEDLVFSLYYAHLFTGEGLEDGVFNKAFGTNFNGGQDDDDVDYIYWRSTLKF